MDSRKRHDIGCFRHCGFAVKGEYMLQRVQRIAIPAILLLAGFTLPGFGQPQQVQGSNWVAQTNSSPAVTSGFVYINNTKFYTGPYIAWQGLNDEVYFAMYNGAEWTDYGVVSGSNWTAETSAAPALVYENSTSLVWLAWLEENSNQIHVSSWNGKRWTHPTTVQGPGSKPTWIAETSVGPALGEQYGLINPPYVAWKGATDDRIWYSYGQYVDDTVQWQQQQLVQESGSDPSWTAESTATPSFAGNSNRDGQYLFWKGNSSPSDGIWYSDGSANLEAGGAINWGQQSILNCDASTDEGPAAATLASNGNVAIAIFWNASSSNAILYDSFFSSDPCGSTVEGAATNVAPAVGGNLDGMSTAILAWKNATDNTIWFLNPTTLPGLTSY
jgi:hypothetical protein